MPSMSHQAELRCPTICPTIGFSMADKIGQTNNGENMSDKKLLVLTYESGQEEVHLLSIETLMIIIGSFQTLKEIRIVEASEQLMDVTHLCASCYRQREQPTVDWKRKPYERS